MSRTTISVLFCLSLFQCVADAGIAHKSQDGIDSLLAGRLTDAVTGAPVTGAIVSVTGSPKPTAQSQMVDSKGRFAFAGLPAGEYLISARRVGYLTSTIGQTRPDGLPQSVQLQYRERVTSVVLRMWPTSSISGRIVDATGRPLVGASVVAFQRKLVGGRASFVVSGTHVLSDDRGVYRIGLLGPGNYAIAVESRLVTFPLEFVSAAAEPAGQTSKARLEELAAKGSDAMGMVPTRPLIHLGGAGLGQGFGLLDPQLRGSDLWTYAPTFYPTAPTPEQATQIVLSAGEQRSGIDFRLSHSRTFAVSGSAIGPEGPVSNLAVFLRPAAQSAIRYGGTFETAQTVTAGDGSFQLLGITPGDYTIGAQWSPSNPARTLSAYQQIHVGNAVEGLRLTLRPTVRIRGKVEFVGTGVRPTRLSDIRITAEPIDGRYIARPFSTSVETDGSFSLSGVTPGQFFVRAESVGNWSLEKMEHAGRDLSDMPITISEDDISDVVATFVPTFESVAGTVRAADGAPAYDAAVVVFPNNVDLLSGYGVNPKRLRLVRVNRNGVFSIDSLAKGDYIVAAISDQSASDWTDLSVLRRLMGTGRRITVLPGSVSRVELILGR